MTEHDRTMGSSAVAAALGLSAASIRAYARQGRLPHRRTRGGHYPFDLGEVRDLLGPPQVREVEGLMDLFAGTGAPVDALSGYRASPFTDAAVRRSELRAHRREANLSARTATT